MFHSQMKNEVYCGAKENIFNLEPVAGQFLFLLFPSSFFLCSFASFSFHSIQRMYMNQQMGHVSFVFSIWIGHTSVLVCVP